MGDRELEMCPGNVNLPIGDGTEAQNANSENGVPRVRPPTAECKSKAGHYRLRTPVAPYRRIVL
jgi:hypothetical protein